MIYISITRGSREAIIKSKEIEKLSNLAIRKAFHKIGMDLKESAAKGILKKPKHGRLYRWELNGRMVLHWASAPFIEDPANFTGKLRKSLGYSLNGASEMKFGAGNQEVDYARILELGGITNTFPSHRIEPRRYLERAIKSRRGNIRRHFEEQLKKVFKS